MTDREWLKQIADKLNEANNRVRVILDRKQQAELADQIYAHLGRTTPS